MLRGCGAVKITSFTFKRTSIEAVPSQDRYRIGGQDVPSQAGRSVRPLPRPPLPCPAPPPPKQPRRQPLQLPAKTPAACCIATYTPQESLYILMHTLIH